MVKRFVETHFGLVLVFACVLGLIFPGLPDIPNESSIVALAALMFISCYKLRDGGFNAVNWREVTLFYALRYVLLPPLLYLIALQIAPSYAAGVFLLSVLPAAVSSPAFTNIYGGVVSISFAVVLASQLLTPLLIPLQFMAIGGEHVTPSPAHLFTTLLLCVVLPMVVYVFTRRHRRSADYFYAQNKFLSILLIVFVIALAVAKQRDVILANPLGVILPLFIALVCYALYIVVGWFVSRRGRDVRITYATCSGFNNAALGVSLALMHFPPEVILFVAASEIGWSLLPIMMRTFLDKAE